MRSPSGRVAEAAHEAGETPAADRQHAVDWRSHHDLPVASIALEADLANPTEVHRPCVVDAMKVAWFECGYDLAERAQVPKGLATATSDDRFVTRCLEVVDVVWCDHDTTGFLQVQQYSVER